MCKIMERLSVAGHIMESSVAILGLSLEWLIFSASVAGAAHTQFHRDSLNSPLQEVKVIFRNQKGMSCTTDCTNGPRMFPSINSRGAVR